VRQRLPSGRSREIPKANIECRQDRAGRGENSLDAGYYDVFTGKNVLRQFDYSGDYTERSKDTKKKRPANSPKLPPFGLLSSEEELLDRIVKFG
jgi:hypothetical protein